MTFLLALDQSTSATKAVLYDGQFNVLDKSVRAHAQSFPKPGWVEHDANEIWENVLAVTRELLERQSERRDNVVGARHRKSARDLRRLRQAVRQAAASGHRLAMSAW